MTNGQNWISPAKAADMVYDVRAPGCDDIGYTLLRPRSKEMPNSLSDLARAKLQPVEPNPESWITRCGMPVTARDHRLMLAAGVADPGSLERLLADYDAAQHARQRVLAALLTVRLSPDAPLHDGFDQAVSFAAFRLAQARRLTSIVALHTAGDELGQAPPHVHILVLGRIHRACGFQGCHPDLTDTSHQMWLDDLLAFQAGSTAALGPA